MFTFQFCHRPSSLFHLQAGKRAIVNVTFPSNLANVTAMHQQPHEKKLLTYGRSHSPRKFKS